MRDLFISFLIFSSVPFSAYHTYIGVLAWSWLSYMNPHRLTWNFAYHMPFNEIVAVATLGSLFINPERKRLPVTGLTVCWALFFLWITLTTWFSLVPELAWPYYQRIAKIFLLVLLTILVMGSRRRLMLLVWVIVLSIGFYSVKGGLFTLLAGGNFRVWGPTNTLIEENNALALATLIIMPLMYYLYVQSSRSWVRLGLLVAFILSALSVLGSHSRGAIIAGVSVAGFFWLKSQQKVLSVVLLVICIPIGLTVMPSSWFDRIETIVTRASVDPNVIGQRFNLRNPRPDRDVIGWWPDDASTIGRVNAWNYAINAANDRITGAGLESWEPQNFKRYAPIPSLQRNSHSIYFGVLADHGWIGLGLFLTIGLLTWRATTNTIRRCRGVAELAWLRDLARMTQVALVAYMTGGAFLTLAYFDLPWHLMAIAVLGHELAKEHVADDETAAARDAPRHPAAGRGGAPPRPGGAPLRRPGRPV